MVRRTESFGTFFSCAVAVVAIIAGEGGAAAATLAFPAYLRNAELNIQVHGGIGFTWEHDAHLYFKRAKSSEILLGDATYHRELLAQRIGI